MTDPHQDIILAELAGTLRRICDHAQPCLSADTMLDDIPGIDSLRLLQAVAHLEQHFRVEIDVVALDDLTHVRDILDAVASARPVPGPTGDDGISRGHVSN